jgi:hypothetical protein
MHIMIDIETLGPSDRAQILQLSAVAFELNGSVCEPHELLQGDDRWIDIVFELDGYGETDSKTEAWWQQPEQIEAAVRIIAQRVRAGVSRSAGLEAFAKFVGLWLGKRGKMWALPPQFDHRIVRGNYGMIGEKVPWHYSQEHDLRTLLWLATKLPQANFKAPSMEGKGLIPHFALHDAAKQAVLAQAAYRALTLTGAQRIAEGVVA